MLNTNVLKGVNLGWNVMYAIQVIHNVLTEFSNKFSTYVEGLGDFRSANISFLYDARGEVSWSRAASPVSGADDDGVMGATWCRMFG